jgi:hypothetical protein
MLFAIGTVLGLLLLSWSTYLFFRESPQITNLIDDQLKLRHFDLSELKQQAESGVIKEDMETPIIKTPTKSGTTIKNEVLNKKDSK